MYFTIMKKVLYSKYFLEMMCNVTLQYMLSVGAGEDTALRDFSINNI